MRTVSRLELQFERDLGIMLGGNAAEFRAVDSNHNGRLSKDELKGWMM